MDHEAAVGQWLSRFAWRDLEDADFAQVDADELFDPAPRLAVEAMIGAVRVAVQLASERQDGLAGMVVIPLPFADGVVGPPVAHPPLSSLRQEEWVYGPGKVVPGLYLVRPAIWQEQVPGIEFRAELLRAELPDGFSGYYRAWQTPEMRADSPQEWHRDLYLRTVS